MAEGHGGHDLGLHMSSQSASQLMHAAFRCCSLRADLHRRSFDLACCLLLPAAAALPAAVVLLCCCCVLLPALLWDESSVKCGRVKKGNEQLEVMAGQSGYAV